MYKLPHFTETDNNKIFSFIEENALATVIGIETEFPVASHLTLQLENEEDKLFLTGHMMRKTDHHKAFEKNENVLVIFSSVPAYITTEWTQNPATASTVNYISVQIKGKIIFTDEAGTRTMIKAITDKYIGTNNEASFDKIDKNYIDENIKAIVGFKIEVIEMDATFKLSQNKTTAEQQNIIKKLEERNNFGDAFIAHKMKQNLN